MRGWRKQDTLAEQDRPRCCSSDVYWRVNLTHEVVRPSPANGVEVKRRLPEVLWRLSSPPTCDIFKNLFVAIPQHNWQSMMVSWYSTGPLSRRRQPYSSMLRYLVPVVEVEVLVVCARGVVCRLKHDRAARYLVLPRVTIHERENVCNRNTRRVCISWWGWLGDRGHADGGIMTAGVSSRFDISK